MRIDKYLKDSRLVKRRTVAKEMCEAQKIQINGKYAKAGSTVQVGDVITLEFAKSFLEVEVVSLQISNTKTLAANAYKELKQTSKISE